jgi:hypothetical protein
LIPNIGNAIKEYKKIITTYVKLRKPKQQNNVITIDTAITGRGHLATLSPHLKLINTSIKQYFFNKA